MSLAKSDDDLKAMRFKEILSGLTGLNLGPVGASWNPPEPEVAKAKRLIAYLEDRRVLYNPGDLEIAEHCVQSVVEIRRFLTDELTNISQDSPLANSLRAMRAACRKFLNHIQARESEAGRFEWHHGRGINWEFIGALGQLRGVFGIHVAQIASRYRIDIEDALASILPEDDDSVSDHAEGKSTASSHRKPQKSHKRSL